MQQINHLNLFKKWVEINDDAPGIYNKKQQIKFKTSMLKSTLCDYTDAYILVNGTITMNGAGTDDNAKRLDERNKGVMFKSAPLHSSLTVKAE